MGNSTPGPIAGVPDPQARARTITLYTDKESFRKALGLGTEDRVYAVLVDREATVLLLEEGPATERSFEGILKACAGT